MRWGLVDTFEPVGLGTENESFDGRLVWVQRRVMRKLVTMRRDDRVVMEKKRTSMAFVLRIDCQFVKAVG